MKRFLSDFKRLLDHVLRVRADHHAKLTRLNDKSHVTIVEPEMFRPENELNISLFTRLERYALKAFQFFYGPRNAGRHIANIKLDHLVASAPARVLNVRCDANRSIRSNLRRGL